MKNLKLFISFAASLLFLLHFLFVFYSLDHVDTDKVDNIMKFSLDLLLCWLGIHRYKVVDISFGFGPSGSVKTIQCKICGTKKIKKG